MKKQKQLMMWIVGFFLMLFSFNSVAQTITCDLRNRTQPTCNSFEFDVFLKTSVANSFQFAMCQLAIPMNPALVNGGIIKVTPVANSSTLTNVNQIPGPVKFSYDAAANMILVTAVSPPGNGQGSQIITTANGTRFIRIRVTNSVSYPAQATNLAFSFADAPLKTKVFAYVSGLNTDISASMTFNVNSTTMPNNATALLTTLAAPVAQTVIGDGGSYCGIPGATGAPVGLAASVNGVAYQLWKNGSAVPGAIIFGRTAGIGGAGSNISFGNQTEGFYQVSAYVCGTGLFPTSATILPPTIPAAASVTITTDQLPIEDQIPASPTTVTFTANPDAFSATTNCTIDWYVNGNYQYTGSPADPSFIWDVNVGDVVQAQLLADPSPSICVYPVVALGNITMHAQGAPLHTLSGAATVCYGATPPVTLAGSDLGYDYQLYIDGTTPYQATKPGTGNPLVWLVSQLGTHTYTCKVVTPSPVTDMLGSAVIQIDPIITPLFTQLGPYCQGATPDALSTTSNNGIAGTWNAAISTATAGTVVYTFTPTPGVGCFSTATMGILVNPSSTIPSQASACGHYLWAVNGVNYTVGGLKTYVDGCTTYTLDLTITPEVTIPAQASACGHYLWAVNGVDYTVGGLKTYVDGCTTYTLDLTITATSVVNSTATACDHYLWAVNGVDYTTSGIKTYVDGCTTYNLNLTINVTGTIEETITATGSYTWPFNGVTYATSGDKTVIVGCTTHILHLTIVPAWTWTQDIGTTLMVSWPATPSATNYAINWRKNGTTTWLGAPSSTTYAKIPNLQAGSLYQWRVISYGPGLYSVSSIQTYTTANPGYEKMYDIGTTCQIGWMDCSPWASSYVFQYRKLNTPALPWNGLGTFDNVTKLNNLLPETTYEWQVRVYKGGNLYGTTTMGTFVTGKIIFTPTNVTTTSLTLTWTQSAPDLAPWTTLYAFHYRPQGSSTWIQLSTYANNTYNLTGLTPGTTYECEVYYYKGSFWGISKIGTFSTPTVKSVGSENSGNGINVYPNPFVEQVNMDMFTQEETNVTWNIYDMTGKVVLSGSQSITTGYSTLNIDAANLPKGVYMLNAVINNQMQSFRIMKQ